MIGNAQYYYHLDPDERYVFKDTHQSNIAMMQMTMAVDQYIQLKKMYDQYSLSIEELKQLRHPDINQQIDKLEAVRNDMLPDIERLDAQYHLSEEISDMHLPEFMLDGFEEDEMKLL